MTTTAHIRIGIRRRWTHCSAMGALLLTASALDAQPSTRWTINGRPTPQARATVAVMRGVSARGLRPQDYGVMKLGEQVVALSAAARPDSAAAARFDTALSTSLLRLLTHLHSGRVPPRDADLRLPETHGPTNFEGAVHEVSVAVDVPAAIARAEDRYAGYLGLVRALARYRVVAADTTLRALAPLATTMRQDASYADAPMLRRWLTALGDLPEGASTVPDSLAMQYDPALAAATRRFQARHGLDSTGILGPVTMAALAVPVTRRVQQIELAIERWRWLPDVPPARYAVANIPAFRLYVFEDDTVAARPVMRMDVIVGRAYPGRRTPVFTATMNEVVLRPYSDIPISIARSEMLPRIRRDSRYLQRETLEIVGGDDDGARTFEPTSGNLARVASGSLRLRQRPGAQNALGPAKFLFPNAHNVYLHGTPARSLFSSVRRDFSHGCIRVADPAALAEMVLHDQPTWDRTRIEEAMARSTPTRIRITRPLGVFILYTTVVVDGGIVRFYPDIYGHDASLQRRLGRR